MTRILAVEGTSHFLKLSLCPTKMNGEDFGELCSYIYEILPITTEVVDNADSFVSLPFLDVLSDPSSLLYENVNIQLNESVNEEKIHPVNVLGETESSGAAHETISKIKCPICAREFKNKLGLSKHMKVHNSPVKERVFTCDHCGKSFGVNSNLKAHINEIHSAFKKYKCEVCQYATNTKANFLNHVRAMHTDVNETGGFICELCDKKFFRRDDLKRHLIRWHGAQGFECETCGKSYTSKQYLSVHKETHRPDFKPEHLCVSCGKLFPNASHLRSHVRLRHSDVKYTCGTCGKELSSRTSLIEHTRSHTGDRPHVCKVCGKAFAAAKYLRVHSRLHTGEKPYLCTYCERTFTQKSSLTVHLRYHTGEKPYRCPVCSKQFVAKNFLQSHMKSH